MATTPFRQIIKPGQSGSDITAVKRALRKMNTPGCGTMDTSDYAGAAYRLVLQKCQRMHDLPADGIYGQKAHAVIAPHFDKYGVQLYEKAKIRQPPIPPVPPGNAAENAKKLLGFHQMGKYVSRNPGDLVDIQKTANGQSVWSQGGYWTHMDNRVMQLLVWLIEQGHKIGTYALCSDHHNDGPHGHSGGLAVDIEWIDGVAIGYPSYACRANVIKIDQLLHKAPGSLKARQLITGGYGNFRDTQISGFSIPSADSFYGSGTMAQHCNHIHVGF